MRGVTLAAVVLLTPAQAVGAQSWRTVDAFRQALAVDTLRVRIDYTVGALRVHAAGDSLLYRAQLRYDAHRFEPVRTFDAASGTLHVGVRGDDRIPLRGSGGKEQGTLTLALGPSQPVDLELDLGATDSNLDFSGIPVSRLVIGSGVSELSLRFATENPVAMSELMIDAGVASVTVDHLGNANAERVRVSGTVGRVELDMRGAWKGTREVQVLVTFGVATIRVPRSVGVRVTHSRVLGTFDAAGFTQLGDGYVSEAWETAEQRLYIDARTTFGSLDVEWIEG
jgi:hypothetical protein